MHGGTVTRPRTSLVTGATSGIGLATAQGLAVEGYRVLMVGRNRQRGEAALERVRSGAVGPDPELLLADLGVQASVRTLAAEILRRADRLDVVVHNAGLTMGRHMLTPDGVETTFAVNHLAPFLLHQLLTERIVESAPSRIVTVASDAHRRGRIELDNLNGERRWSSWGAYCQSKLANVLWTNELARRLEGAGVTANSMHPGVVATGFGRQGSLAVRLFFRLFSWTLVSPEKGADTVLYLATAPAVEGISGRYWQQRRTVQPSPAALNRTLAAALWQRSEELVRGSAAADR